MAARAASRVYESPIWPWLLVSGIVHGLIALIGVGVMAAGWLVPGRGLADGSGFGGDSIELELEGPRDQPATGSVAAGELEVRTPPAAAPPAAQEEQQTLAAPTEGPAEAATPDAPREARPRPERPREAAAVPPPSDLGAPEGTTETVAGEGDPGGTGASASTAGAQAGDPTALILGAAGLGGSTVAARQALLPNDGACTDPAIGTWRSQKYRASNRTWVRFTLRVRRAGEQLSGTITSRIYNGRASDPRPGPCTAFGADHTWHMEARGSLASGEMRFEARRARMVREDCPQSGTIYAPDRFRGSLRGEVFDAVNNDGAYDVDEPYTFRRTSCEP